MYKIYGISKDYNHEYGTRFIEESESLDRACARILELTRSDNDVCYVVAENDEHALEKRRQLTDAVSNHRVMPDIPLFRVSEEKKDIMSFNNYFDAYSYAKSFSKNIKDRAFLVSLEHDGETTIEDILMNGTEFKGGF